MPKLGLISLGCAKNLVDSEHMLARLRDAGWEITEDMTEADVGVVNTCGFIEGSIFFYLCMIHYCYFATNSLFLYIRVCKS